MSLKGVHVAVLMGGLSEEREVSLSTGAGCLAALERLGARVTAVDAGRDVAEVLARLRPDVAFNALHGIWGEDGCIQGILETLQIPYTHSGVLASALTMDKTRAKDVMIAAGVPAPGGLFDRDEVARRHVMAPPYVVKPNAGGSSVGVYIIREGDLPPAQLGASADCRGEMVLVEPFTAGKELCVTVLGETSGSRALTVTDIISVHDFYDYASKYIAGGSRHIIPAEISPEIFETCLRMAERAHDALGCRGVTRSDFRYDDVKNDLVLLEVNTQPGMTPTSLVPEQAAHTGMSYDDLVKWILEDASCPRECGGVR